MGLFAKKNKDIEVDDKQQITILYNKFEKQMDILKKKIKQKTAYKEIIGIVMQGEQKMAKVCFPTANIECNIKITNGFYASNIKIDDIVYQGLCFVNSDENIAEIYIFNFNKNIYGKKILVQLVQFVSLLQDITNISIKEQFIENIKIVENFFKNKSEETI